MVILPDFTGWSIRDTADWLNKAGLGFKPSGSGFASSQYPMGGSTLERGDIVEVLFTQ